MKRVIGFLAMFLAMIGLLSSCGGGGGSAGSAGGDAAGPASALTVAEKVSVVDAQSEGGSGAPARIRAAVRALSLPADSDYNTDRATVYVQEQSVQSFNTVNEILCMVAQTRYDAMLNLGPYKAQIDMNLCKGKDSASAGAQQSANQSSGANMPNYAFWTVDVSRDDNSAPQIIKVWIHEPSEGDYDPDKLIYAKAVITEGTSATNPYGLFTINFDGYPVVNGVPSSQSMFNGILKTEMSNGKVLLKFFQTSSFEGNSGSEAAALDRSADGTSGGGTIQSLQLSPSPRTKTFDIAYNSSNFHRVNAAAGKDFCLSRTTFDESAWRYGVYDSNGARVLRNSGFPVRFSQSGQDVHGYIGYYGSWFPGDVTLSTGDSVYKQSYGPGGTEVRYEVLTAGGKLRKHSRSLLTLADITGIPLDYMEWTGTGNDNQYRVLWNGATFTKVAQMNKTNWTWENLSSTVDIDLATLKFSELNFFSQALSGNVQIKLQGCSHNDGGTPSNPSDDTFSCTADDSTPVVSYSDVAVDPSDTVPATLACFENCPDISNLDGSNPFLPFTGYQPVAPSSATYTPYTFDNANMVLKSGSTAVVASTLDNAFQWGLMSGPLFDPSTANLDLLRCPWDNNTCPWQAMSNLPVFYSWETGPNNWNHLVAVKDPAQSTFVKFDPPLVLQYSHTGNGYTNAKFSLQYDGFGNLNGIPGKCVNMDTGANADCSQGGPGSSIRWVPEFTIPDGSVLTEGSNTYYAKALEKEQRMKKELGACVSLPVTSYADQLPTASDWTDPALGTEPDVTGAPAVIGGVLQ